MSAVTGRKNANSVTLARLVASQRQALAEMALRERLSPLVADILTGATTAAGALPVDGSPVDIEQQGLHFKLSLNDVGGLVDIYFASPATLALLPASAAEIEAGRQKALASLPPGRRFATLEQSLAQFGLDRDQRLQIMALTTQSGRSAGIDPQTAPEQIRSRMDTPAQISGHLITGIASFQSPSIALFTL